MEHRRQRDAALERRTGQYVVRQQRESQIYSYIPENKEKKKRRPADYDGFDFVVFILKCIVFGLAALLTAFLVVKSYPKASNYVLAWIALVPFLAALRRTTSLSGALLFGLVTGFLTYCGLFYWIYDTCRAGGVEPALSFAALGGLALIVSLQFTVFSGFAFYLRKTGLLFPVFAAMGWVSFEFIHQIIAYNFLGFPWFMMGYSQWARPEFLQAAAFGGVFAVSFAIVCVNGYLAVALTISDFLKRLTALVIAVVLFFGLFAFGKMTIDKPEGEVERTVRFSILQPNIDLYKKWNASFEQEIEDTLKAQITTATAFNPDIVVWPESALPGNIQEGYYAGFVRDLAQESNAYQLVGSNRFAEEDKQYVSAYFINPSGDIAGIYSKQTLVPFGEYVPLQHRLEKLGISPAVLGQLGVFSPGPANQSLMQIYGIKFAVTICYESIFHKTWLNGADAGAKFFVNITNDGWYLDTAAPYQHFAVNVLRAVEMGKPVIRSANTGISGLIDGKGRILKESNLNEGAVLDYELPLYNTEDTFYVVWGDLFSYICMLVFFTSALAAFVVSND